jgi:hypothetical protein
VVVVVVLAPENEFTVSFDAVNCPARSRTRNRELCGAIARIHQKVPDLWHGLGPVGFAVPPRMCAYRSGSPS